MNAQTPRSVVDSEKPTVNVPPPIPAFSLVGSLSPLLLVPALLPALIALFAPADVLDRLPWLRHFTNWMVAHVPYMDVHANSTIHPQMALLVNCLVIAVVPLLSAVIFWQAWVNYPYLLERRRVSGSVPLVQHLFFLLGPPIMLGVIAAMVMLSGDPSWALGTTTHRRGFYAFSAFVAPYGAGICIGTQLLNIRLFIDTHLRQGSFK